MSKCVGAPLLLLLLLAAMHKYLFETNSAAATAEWSSPMSGARLPMLLAAYAVHAAHTETITSWTATLLLPHVPLFCT
jgi:hypothetical protein